MLVIGHRGAAALARENTLEALRAGLEADADILEFDIRLTKDAIPVLTHDFHTYRTHHDISIISQLTLAELKERTHKNPIVTLQEALDEFFGVILLNIELKGRGTATIATKLIKDDYITSPKDWDNILFSSFKASELAAVRRISPKANLALLHGQNPFMFVAYHRKLRLTAVGFHRLYVNPLALAIAKKTGIFVYAYTVNRPHTALMLAQQGVDGIVTDNPAYILAEVKKYSN